MPAGSSSCSSSAWPRAPPPRSTSSRCRRRASRSGGSRRRGRAPTRRPRAGRASTAERGSWFSSSIPLGWRQLVHEDDAARVTALADQPAAPLELPGDHVAVFELVQGQRDLDGRRLGRVLRAQDHLLAADVPKKGYSSSTATERTFFSLSAAALPTTRTVCR